MIKGILLDKDGTIIDFFKIWAPAIRPVLKRILSEAHLSYSEDILILLEKKLGVSKGKIDPEGGLAWKPYIQIAEDLNQGLEEVFHRKLNVNELEDKLIRYFTKETEGYYPVFTDMKQFLQFTQDKGIQVGVVTTDTLQSTKACLEALEIASRIHFIATSDNDFPVKPDGRIIEEAAKKWNCLPNEIMVVGDTPNDMRFAQNGGAIPVGVLSGVSHKKDLQLYTENILPSLSELDEFLLRKQWV